MTHQEILNYIREYAMGLDGLPMPQVDCGEEFAAVQLVSDREGLMLVRCMVQEIPSEEPEYAWVLEFDDGEMTLPLQYGFCDSVALAMERGAEWMAERALWELLPRGYRAPGAPRLWEGGAA